MKQDISKELIFSHFAHKSSPLQRKMIDEWLQIEANEEQYFAWLEEWEQTHPQYLPQSELALENYEAFLEANPHTHLQAELAASEPVVSSNRRYWFRWLAAASVVLVLGGVGWLFRGSLLYQTYQTAFGETKSLLLPDGSKVTLNANSLLRLPRFGFGTKNREVFLKGEASFSVTHTPDHQKFVVKTNKQFEVVVLGTEFSVYARQRISKVVLSKGKVQVRYQQGRTQKQIVLTPGDLVTLDRENNMDKKAVSHPQNYAAWEQKRFVFEETSLQDVAYLLQENYGLEVEIKDKDLSERVIMGSFRAENVDQLLQSISELLDISVVRQGNRVQLSDK
ncbi:ferric-dicitrate binding protein FerR (iron transport regulator) [Runella defluvii]|uniref:Ferric-dicitrate binding protein FerR (Iron transport regulator) n=1 Tax=Runella defluvii TaxID=370973 RepID=A0A7W5ZM01_9BACT|nr:FecR domain-containing protein [Runella defluvii]MBB3839333.1 ferric-dicitrate binding protein FerR (iron transport regulator) [Runella defluvii]